MYCSSTYATNLLISSTFFDLFDEYKMSDRSGYKQQWFLIRFTAIQKAEQKRWNEERGEE